MSNNVEAVYCPDGVGEVEIDIDDLTEAVLRWRRGEKREALHQLENALDGNFHGLGDIRPEDLR